MNLLVTEKIRLKKALRNLLGKGNICRDIPVFSDDVFITSFPRSGNTWVRFLVANLVWNDDRTTFLNLDNRIPDIYKFSDDFLLSLPRPRYMKSHEAYNSKYPKLLYIVRDVRSVILSYYHYLLRVGEITHRTSYYKFTKLFLSGHLDYWGTWRDHVESWLTLRGHNDSKFCLIRYEDLKEDGMTTLGVINTFLQLNRSDDELELALKKSSFENMKKHEKEAGGNWVEAKYAKDNKSSFVRVGTIDDWKQVLDNKSLRLLHEEYSDLLMELSYEL